MAQLDLLLVGPASRSTGGVAQFLTEQRRHLPSSIDVRVHDDRTLDEQFTDAPARATANALRGVADLTARSPPDVVHVHSSHGLSFYRAAVYVLYAAHVWDAGVVLHVHGSSFDDFLETDNPLTRRVQSAVFEASDAVVVLSSYWRRAFEGHVDEEKVHIVPNGVDVEDYDPAQISEGGASGAARVRGDGGSAARDGRMAAREDSASAHPRSEASRATDDAPTLTFVSNHVERKGIVELVEAIDRLQRDGSSPFQARIAGDGPAAAHAESLAERHEAVEYLGYVSEAEKRVLLAESTIYALPSHAEGLPIALLEGMATGNAVVSTTVGSIPEVVDEESGRLVTPGDVDELTDALGWLIEHPDSTREMGERNYELVRETYSWEAVVDRLVDAYEAVAPEASAATAASR